MVGHGQIHVLLGKSVYGLFFIVLLPLLLVFWSNRLDDLLLLQVPPWQGAGIILCLTGLALMALAMNDLRVRGHGLPMNAYPPEAFVTQGVYAWFSHPIYLGAVLTSLGAALWSQSSSGLYVITPVLALACCALVIGYERLALRRLFGAAEDAYRPLFGLRPAAHAATRWPTRAAMVVRVFRPWLVVGYLIDFARCQNECSLGFARLFAPQRWLGIGDVAWMLPFVALATAFLLVRAEAQLRYLVISGSIATAGILFAQLVAPSFLGTTLSNETAPTLASLAVVGAALAHRPIWRALQQLCEWVANSRRDWLFFDGRFRIISHSVFSFLAGVVAAGMSGYMAGYDFVGPALIVCALVGAALYAQVSWGSSALLRPFGFWGGGAGAAAGVLVLCLFLGVPVSQLAVAIVLAAPFAQALGRLRCLAQGCCHGVPTDARFGIRVWQPQSRVCVLSGLTGRYILITQLYSILFNLLLGLLLIAMWRSQVIPVALIVAAYLILTSIERFAEDGYRGETQTRVIFGLKEPQWMALGGLVAGILCSFLPYTYASTAVAEVDAPLVAGALLGGVVCAFGMSMDFPKSHARFSRLSG